MYLYSVTRQEDKGEEEVRMIEELIQQVVDGEVTGDDLSNMMKEGKINKTERRKIIKSSKKIISKSSNSNKMTEMKEKDNDSLTTRQKIRLEVKEKKLLPKLTKEERKRKYTTDIINEREAKKSKYLECLGCRKKGHMLKDCPEATTPTTTEKATLSGHCFNCGSHDHALRNCPHPYDGKELKYAKCFICGDIGHISKMCPENGNGLYPKGGCCHICLQKTHLVKDCPEKGKDENSKRRDEDEKLGPRIGQVVDDDVGGDYDDFDHLAVNESDDDISDEDKKKKKKSKKSKSLKDKKKSK